MSTPRFQVVTTPGDAPGHPATHLVVDRAAQIPVGGFGAGYYRPWVFPFYTPAGKNVIQAYPFDHPFHNGIFVGANPVYVDGRQANFWAVPPRRKEQDAVFHHVGRMDRADVPWIRVYTHGVQFVQYSIWRDEQGQPVLDEVRTVTLGVLGDVHLCDVTTCMSAVYGDLQFPATKFGILCVRVEPRLVPACGGRIQADGAREGQQGIHGIPGRYVVMHNPVWGNGPYGVLMSDPEPEERDPWCVGAYGIVSRNPVLWQERSVPRGTDWCCSLRVIAFDGAFRDDRIGDWLEAPLHLQ